MQFNQPDTLIPDLYNSLDWNRYSYARGNPLKYTDPDGHNPVLIALAVVVIILKVVDYGWTAYDAGSALVTAIDSNNSPEIRQEALGNAAAAVGMELLEPDDLSPIALPLDDIVRHADDIGEFIYKSSSGSAKTLTPRSGIDDLNMETGGLSFFNDPAKMGLEVGEKYVVVDPTKLDGLNVIFDNVPPGHVSVKPPTLDALREWASTRGVTTHSFTETIINAIKDIRKWK